jgi:hypothetical protein
MSLARILSSLGLFKLFAPIFSFACLVALSNGFAVDASANQQVQLNEEDVLVMQLAAADYVSEEPLFIYHSPDLTMLPVKALADSLGVALALDSDTLVIEGWRGTEENSFRIDLPRKEFYRQGVRQDWSPQTQYADDGFDVYVDQQSRCAFAAVAC